MKTITLSDGKVTKVDDVNYDFFSQFEWHSKSSKKCNDFHAVRYVNIGKKRITIYMHRLVTEARADQRVEHVNNDGLDNRQSNLQLRTLCAWTSRPSGYHGVDQMENNKWAASVEFAGRKHIIGNRYTTAVEAAIAYNDTVVELFGKHAQINSI